jgi:hypothetical protein
MIALGTPKNDLQIKSLGMAAKPLDKPIVGITLLGGGEKVQWSQADEALTISVPKKMPNDAAIFFKIQTSK